MLKSTLIATLAVVTVLIFAPPTMSREFADIYTECGLGALIAPRNGAVAAVTNVTWDLGTTAISSNISSPDTCNGGQEKTAAFIYDSYSALETELASGDGPYLNALILLSGCEQQVHKELISVLRNDFAKVVAEPGYAAQSSYEQANTLYGLLYKRVNSSFSQSCS